MSKPTQTSHITATQEAILKRLELLMRLYPATRIMQVILNVHPEANYYTTDEELLERLRRYHGATSSSE